MPSGFLVKSDVARLAALKDARIYDKLSTVLLRFYKKFYKRIKGCLFYVHCQEFTWYEMKL